MDLSHPTETAPAHPTGFPPPRPWTVIGMLSGTSYDAVDAAAAELRFDGGEIVLRPLGLHSEPYPAPLREEIAASLPPASTSLERVCRLDTGLGRFFGEVA